MLVRYQISIPSRIIKENSDIFAAVPHFSFNNSIYQSEFPSILKLVNITPVFKRVTKILRKTRDQSAYFQTSQISLNDARFVKFPDLWIPIYQNNNIGLEKVTAHSIAYW